MSSAGAPSHGPPFAARVQALLKQDDTNFIDFRTVLHATFWAALVISGATALALRLPLHWTFILLVPTFALLLTCLLYRATVWIPACLTAPAMGALVGALFLGLTDYWAVPALAWPAAIVGFVLGTFLMAAPFIRVGRIARSIGERSASRAANAEMGGQRYLAGPSTRDIGSLSPAGASEQTPLSQARWRVR